MIWATFILVVETRHSHIASAVRHSPRAYGAFFVGRRTGLRAAPNDGREAGGDMTGQPTLDKGTFNLALNTYAVRALFLSGGSAGAGGGGNRGSLARRRSCGNLAVPGR